MNVAIITGSTGAIGKAIARNIALDHSYTVHLIARNLEKAKSTKKDIIHKTKNQKIEYHIVDIN